MTRPLILVGLPGSGKSSVGQLLFELLPTEFADFVDLDQEVEAAVGSSVPHIFAESGEAEFRRLERDAMERLLDGPPRVIAAGGGWMAEPGNLAAARRHDPLVVYLRVAPEVAARRLGDAAGRPLLAGDTKARLAELLAERESWYLQADAQVDAESDPATVAAQIAELIRSVA